MANKLKVQDFLNPASMLTPGLAGAVTMMITNALALQFGLEPAGIGLATSFLVGTLVWASEGVPIVRKAVYYVVNSLIIFSVAAGTSGFGSNFTREASLAPISSAFAKSLPEESVPTVQIAQSTDPEGRLAKVSAQLQAIARELANFPKAAEALKDVFASWTTSRPRSANSRE